jgi:Bacterial Ig domain/K319L-like, PKD domain
MFNISTGGKEKMNYRNGNQYHKNWILIGVLALVMLCWGGIEAGAVSSYLNSFTSQYPAANGTRLDVCILCHNSSSGGSRNPYGSAYSSNGHSFTNIEGLDSDGDGVSNIDEIGALTFPGNGNDFPNQPPANRAPSASNNSYSVNAGDTLTVSAPGVLGNDSDPDGDSLTAVLGSGPSSGTLNLSANGSFTYTPTVGSGQVTFTYRASDGNLTSSLATVTITVTTVTPANRAPSASNNSYSVNAGDTLTVSAPGVLGNDSDPDNDPLTAVLGTGPSSGTLNLSGNGSFTYTPTVSSGQVAFTYRASDGSLTSSLATVTITVTAVSPTNTPPTANAGQGQTVTAGPGGTASVTLDGSGSSDSEGPITSYSWSGPFGTATGPSPTVTLAEGTHTITLTVTDSDGATDTATVSITVTPDIPAPPPSETGNLSVTPPDGATNVPVMAAVVISADSAGALNGATITLAESTPSFVSASDPGGIVCVNGGVVTGTIAYDDLFMHATFTPDCPLANGMSYTLTITPKGDTQPVISTFTTIVQTADTDEDGVEDGEDDRPDDDTEATPPKSKKEGKFRVSIGKDGHRHLRRVRGISDTHFSINQNHKPHGYEFRDGLVDFEVHGISPGETVEVDIDSPEEIPSGSKVFRSDRDGFREIHAVIRGNRFTVTVTDGGVGDSDGQANGVIVDPIGVAVPAAAADGSTGATPGAAGGGCSVAGSGGGWKEAAGSYGLLALVWLGLALRRKQPENGR